MARKSKKKDGDVDVYKQTKDKRKHVVQIGLASCDTVEPKPKKYEYDPRAIDRSMWDLYA